MSNKRGAGRSGRRRKTAKRGGYGVLYGAVTTVAAIALVLLGISVFFKIDHIEMRGSIRYTTEQICETAEIETGDFLYLFNKFSAINKVFLKLPYVEEIRIRRQLPGTLFIEITEAVPAASIAAEGGYWLVSPRGKLLEFVGGDTTGAVRPVTGLALSLPAVGEIFTTEVPEQGQPLLWILDLMDRNGLLARVDSMDFSDLYDIRIAYDGRLTLIMGLPENLDKKLAYFLEVDKKLGENARGTVDLSGDKIIYTPQSAGS